MPEPESSCVPALGFNPAHAAKALPQNNMISDRLLEPDSEVYEADLRVGSVRRLSMTEIIASLAKPSATMDMAS